jgi:hypothetical protein
LWPAFEVRLKASPEDKTSSISRANTAFEVRRQGFEPRTR